MLEKKTKISGIYELKIIDENSILIKCAKHELLCLSKGENTGLGEAIICIEERFNLADADHISDTYKLVEIREDAVILEAEWTFTGAGIPEEEWTKKKVISVSPYISP